MSAEPTPLQLGSLFVNKYEIRGLLGKGGQGFVYDAFDTIFQRPVAIKVIPKFDDLGANSRHGRRALNEALALGSITHRNVVRIYDANIHGDLVYLAMEKLNGRTLRQALREHERLTLREALELTLQIAEGVAAAHAQGIIHRDLKPENVVIQAGNECKVLDFGIAKLVSAIGHTTQKDTVPGTLLYMAPEQLEGRPVTLRADVYSLGTMLYEMLHRHPLLVGENTATFSELGFRVLYVTPPTLHQLDATIPEDVSRVLEVALNKRPEPRFRSMAEMGQSLRTALDRMVQEGRATGSDISRRDLSVRTSSSVARAVRRAKPAEPAASRASSAAHAAPVQPAQQPPRLRTELIPPAALAPAAQEDVAGAEQPSIRAQSSPSPRHEPSLPEDTERIAVPAEFVGSEPIHDVGVQAFQPPQDVPRTAPKPPSAGLNPLSARPAPVPEPTIVVASDSNEPSPRSRLVSTPQFTPAPVLTPSKRPGERSRHRRTVPPLVIAVASVGLVSGALFTWITKMPANAEAPIPATAAASSTAAPHSSATGETPTPQSGSVASAPRAVHPTGERSAPETKAIPPQADEDNEAQMQGPEKSKRPVVQTAPRATPSAAKARSLITRTFRAPDEKKEKVKTSSEWSERLHLLESRGKASSKANSDEVSQEPPVQ